MDEAARSEARPAPRLRGRRVLAAIAVALLVLLIAIASVLTWSVRTERGNAWLLSLLPGVQITAPKGTLIGDFDAQRITIHLPGGSDTVTLDGVRWRGLRVERAAAALWVRIGIDSLTVRRVDVAIAASKNAEPLKAPADLRVPIELDVRALRIDELHANALGEQPLRDLAARVHLSANDGAEHRIDDLALGWERVQARGSARIASATPMPLRAVLGLAQQGSDALPAWSASAALTGPLAAPMLQATLRAAASVDRPGRPEQSLDLRAALRPFATWPLGELQASASALDLSAFAGTAPSTALTLQASATSTAADQPASLRIDATNALAGRWNEGRLPLRRLQLELAARPDQPSAIELRRLDAELGTAQAAAGRVQGQGRWAPERWNLAATLAAVQPALLDARAPAMPLSGPITLASDPSASGAVSAKAELTGLLAERGNARAVRLRLDASASAQRIELRELQATAGGARAALSGLVTHTAVDAPWAVKAQAELVDFDPALWWPGRDDSPWRKANHRLNATGRADLSLPASALQRPLLDQLAALRGEAAVTLGKSVLAGVPISGEATLRSATGAQATAALQLDADGNRARAEGRLSTTGNGAADAWDVTLDGPTLARLAPVFKLIQPSGADATLAGSLSANAHVSGRWPALSTQGQLEANALRAGALSVQKAQARWTIGTSATAPVEAQATLTQLALARTGTPGPSLESLQLQLAGTGRAHTLELHAESKARPPAWAESVQSAAAPPSSAAAPTRTLALLQAQGGLIDTPAAGWRGVIGQLELRSSTGTAPLLRTRDVTIEALWSGGPLRATLQPGRAELLGGAVRWSRIAWQAASGPGSDAQIEAEADIEPLRIAPLLARAQPDFGWGGDLSVAGHVKLKSAPTFSADVVIERSAGDLTVTDELGTLALGLTDLRLGLAAENGTWNFVQGLAGKSLGVLAGAVVARTSPTATWPAAETPIEGVLELRVADLGTWGTWVPPGWRLGGAMHASASIGGRLNGPEFTGELDGTQLSVRNFLQGVNVSEGDVAIALRGNTARIERFTAKAGSGSIRLEGNASLGDAPKATLQLSADKFQLLGRVDRRIVASGAGQLQLDARRLAFDGRFNVDEGLIDFTRSDAPALSSDVEVVRAKGVASPAAAASAAAAPATTAAPTERDVALDLRVGLGEQLRVKGRGLDTGLRGELRITSPGGRLAVNGTVSAIDGTYAAYGQKLSIDRGLIAFSGAVENPRLDIEATRPNIDTRVGVIISGSAANPRVRLFSEPELSEIDKLSWLVMGRASDGLGRTETALLQRAALALLAGEGSGPTDQITKALGLDEISVRQSDGEVRETVIALGKQLSRRWYVGYERGLNATTGSFQLIYRIAQRFTLRAQSGEENSLDVIWTWRWN
jgi:translocation and assembly module TamB